MIKAIFVLKWIYQISSSFVSGLEEFEQKIDTIASGNGVEDSNSWISDLYKEYEGKFKTTKPTAFSTDGLEPPMLDTMWENDEKIEDDGAEETTDNEVGEFAERYCSRLSPFCFKIVHHS